MSVAQVAELVGAENEKKSASVIKIMESSGQVERVGGLMLPRNYSLSPLVHWKANSFEPTPNFESLAYQLKSRRTSERTHTTIWRATPAAFQTMGLRKQKRPARRGDWEHDLGLTATWLHLREEITANNRVWVLEDDFDDEFPNSLCKPDAIIKSEDGQTEFIEYGGCYSADTLRNKFESWSHINWRLY